MAESERPRSYDVFIAHAGDAHDFSARLARRLELVGLRVFFDARRLNAGDGFDARLEPAAKTCTAFVFVISTRSAEQDAYSRTELDWAVRAQRWSLGVHAIGHEKVKPPPALDGLTSVSIEGDRIAQTVSVVSEHCASVSRRRRTRWVGGAVVVALSGGLVLALTAASPKGPTTTPTGRPRPPSGVPTARPLPAPTPDMARILGQRLPLGVPTAESFNAWCIARVSDAPTCDEFLARVSNREATVQTFDLDRNEVSSSDFAKWVTSELRAGSMTTSSTQVIRASDRAILWLPDCHGIGAHRIDKGEVQDKSEKARVDVRQAVACVSAEGAAWYCKTRGKRLPTEEEWELAAGGVPKRWLPWDPGGHEHPSCDDAVFDRENGVCKHLQNRPQVASTTDRDVTPEGVRALGGNVSEWVVAAPPTNGGQSFLVKGGSWDGKVIDLHPAKRQQLSSSADWATVGFRCACSPSTLPALE